MQHSTRTYLQVAALQQQNPGRIESVHMSYLQEDTGMASPGRQAPPAVPQITFLYKLVSGVADRSFGLNVARLAHLPATVVDRAAEQAAQLEQVTLNRTRYTCALHAITCRHSSTQNICGP